MNNILLFIVYFFFACAGMVFIKLGGQPVQSGLFTLPVLQLKVTLLTLLGFLFYGVSFLLYSVLLVRYELSFLNPVTIGITSILIFICAVAVFNETITVAKLVGLLFILVGVVIINTIK